LESEVYARLHRGGFAAAGPSSPIAPVGNCMWLVGRASSPPLRCFRRR